MVYLHHILINAVFHEIVENSPMVKGATSFTAMDEHYQMDANDDIDIFLYSTSPLSKQAAGWTRKQGKGKVCVLTPGHTLDVWNHECFKTLLINCLNWCDK